MLRGDGGWRVSKRPADSNRGERGEVGRIAGEARGDGILGAAGCRGGCARVGEAAFVGAVLRMCWILVFVIREGWCEGSSFT